MKTFIILTLLSLTLVSCNSEDAKSSSATINGMSADQAFAPYMLKTKGTCAEGDFKAEYVVFNNVEFFLKANGNAIAHQGDVWQSTTWKYEGTEIVFNEGAHVRIINYNGEDTPFLDNGRTHQGYKSEYDQQKDNDISCEDFVAHIDSLL